MRHSLTLTSREVDEDCVLLGYYATSSGNFVPTFRDSLSVPSSLIGLSDPLKWDLYVVPKRR